VDRFAREWRDQHQGKWQEVERLGGFCLLIKRAALARAGNPQGQAGLGVFDTDGLCARVRQAGYTLACCRDLFVHHFGSRSFAHGGPATGPR
jgi:GT2 family glycosyltransferase